MKNKSIINNALLKYGYAKFSLEILEYCEPIKCIKREQYYLYLLKPEYNLLKTAGSLLGYKNLEERSMKGNKNGRNVLGRAEGAGIPSQTI